MSPEWRLPLQPTVRGCKLPSRELKASGWFKEYTADPFGGVRTGEALDVYEHRVEALRQLALGNGGLLDTSRGQRRTFEDLIPHLVGGTVTAR